MELYGDLDGNVTTNIVPLMPRVNRHTMRSSGDSAARIGQYASDGGVGNQIMYQDGYTVATTREAAEASAFGR
jgi:hypothetical protein